MTIPRRPYTEGLAKRPAAVSQKQKPETMTEYVERMRARQRELRRERRAAGLCIDCRKPADPGRSRCGPCGDYSNAARRRDKQNQKLYGRARRW